MNEEDAVEPIEDIFNINNILTTLFSSIQSIADEQNTELIYAMNSTLPKELRGDPETLLQLLTKLLTFVLQNSDRDEIVLSLLAPEDFLYEECVSFNIQKTNIDKDELEVFLETNVSNELARLNGRIIHDHDNASDIELSIPFKVIELGFRRHYRLPDKSMVGKKILLLCSNNKTGANLKKMFAYFLYDVHIGFDEFKEHGNDLSIYDIVIISEKVITEELQNTIAKVQEQSSLRYVLFKEADSSEDADSTTVSHHFIKPATQEKVFDLIVSLYLNKIDISEM